MPWDDPYIVQTRRNAEAYANEQTDADAPTGIGRGNRWLIAYFTYINDALRDSPRASDMELVNDARFRIEYHIKISLGVI